MTALSDRRCEVCRPGTPTIEGSRAEELLAQIQPEWEIRDRELRRRFRFPDFGSAFALAREVAGIAEEEGHHPDMRVGWGYLEVRFTTHAAKGLTMNDFTMAAKVDRLDGVSPTSVE